MEIHHFDGIYQERWGFSWAMLVYQRVPYIHRAIYKGPIYAHKSLGAHLVRHPNPPKNMLRFRSARAKRPRPRRRPRPVLTLDQGVAPKLGGQFPPTMDVYSENNGSKPNKPYENVHGFGGVSNFHPLCFWLVQHPSGQVIFSMNFHLKTWGR